MPLRPSTGSSATNPGLPAMCASRVVIIQYMARESTAAVTMADAVATSGRVSTDPVLALPRPVGMSGAMLGIVAPCTS